MAYNDSGAKKTFEDISINTMPFDLVLKKDRGEIVGDEQDNSYVIAVSDEVKVIPDVITQTPRIKAESYDLEEREETKKAPEQEKEEDNEAKREDK